MLTRKQLSSFLKINVTPCPKVPKEKLKLQIERKNNIFVALPKEAKEANYLGFV